MISFSSMTRLFAVLTVISGTQGGYAPKKYNVIGIVSPPYITATNTSGKYTGYIIDLLDGLKSDDFDYTFTVSPDGVYGDYFANGTITGLIQAVHSGQYDIAAAELTVTRNRSKAVDFTRLFTQPFSRIAKNSNFDKRTVQYYVISSTPLLNYLNKTTFSSLASIWANIQAQTSERILDTDTKTSAVVQRMVNGENVALVGEAGDIAKAIRNHTDKIFYETDPKSFYIYAYSFAVKLGSALRRIVSLKLDTLAENGYIDNIFAKYFGTPCSGSPGGGSSNAPG